MAVGAEGLIVTFKAGIDLSGCCLQRMDDPEAGRVAPGNTLRADSSLGQIKVEFAALVAVDTKGIRMAAFALGVRFGGFRSVFIDPQRSVCLGRAQRSVCKLVLLVAGKADLLFRYDAEGAGLVTGQTIVDVFILVHLV